MLETSITALDKMLTHWQNKIKKDTTAQVEYAYPQLLKYLVIELQEYSFTMKKVLKVIVPTSKVDFKKEVIQAKIEQAPTSLDKNEVLMQIMKRVGFKDMQQLNTL